MPKHDPRATLWDAITAKFGEEPAQIEKLRDMDHDQEAHRVWWADQRPSVVVVAGWNESQTKLKWLKQAKVPRAGGTEIGG